MWVFHVLDSSIGFSSAARSSQKGHTQYVGVSCTCRDTHNMWVFHVGTHTICGCFMKGHAQYAADFYGIIGTHNEKA